MASAADDVLADPARGNRVHVKIPVIVIPTTAGSGSEVTPNTVVNETATHRKLVFRNPGLVPVAALIDYETTLSMPRELTADTGLDSLSHAIEALASVHRSDYTDMLAFHALALIAGSLERVFEDPADLKARENMMLAATLSAMAAVGSSIGIVHEMSRPLSAHFHVPHGRANAMLMPHTIALLSPSNFERYAQCARKIGAADPDQGARAACMSLIRWLEDLNRKLSVGPIRSLGIDSQAYARAIEPMAGYALQTASAAANDAMKIGLDDIVAIYRKLY
jgi:alcohol dehydrogenase class IV